MPAATPPLIKSLRTGSNSLVIQYSICKLGLDMGALEKVALDMGQANILCVSRCQAATRVKECRACDLQILHRFLNHLTASMKPLTHLYLPSSYLPVFPCLWLNAYIEERLTTQRHSPGVVSATLLSSEDSEASLQQRLL